MAQCCKEIPQLQEIWSHAQEQDTKETAKKVALPRLIKDLSRICCSFQTFLLQLKREQRR